MYLLIKTYSYATNLTGIFYYSNSKNRTNNKEEYIIINKYKSTIK